MQGFGCGSIAISGSDFRIGHESMNHQLEMAILERGDKVRKSLPELVDVFGGLGKVVGEVDFGFAQFAQLVDRELKAVLILVDEAFDLEEVILLESFENFVDVVPHFGFELAAAVAEGERQVTLAGLLGFDLLAHDDESRSDDLILLPHAIADVKVFHRLSEGKGRIASGDQRMPSFFFFFFPSFLASDSLAAAVRVGLVWLGLAPVSM